jgi:MoaA/NifB/PqqE/SkfB family radical SAM enzyme
MQLEHFQRVFDQFKGSINTLDLTGLGESLMHPQIFEIIRYVRQESKVHIYLTSNTLLLTEKYLAGLKQDPVDTLCISIDGVTSEQFSLVRGRMDYGKLKERVKAARQSLSPRTEFILCVVLVEENYRDMPRFVELAKELGIGRLSLKPINLVGNSIPSSYYQRFRTEEFEQLADQSRVLGKEFGIHVDVFEIGRYSCSFPWDPIYVTWDGFVVPCCAKPFPKHVNFGNLLKESWAEIRNKPPFVQFRKQLLSDAPPKFCNKCHIMEKTLFREA